MTSARRIAAFLLFAPAFVSLAPPPVTARTEQRAAASAAPAPRPWLYENSDVPMDPAWLFGELPNGVRYAIRRNGVPPGQVSIRVRMDVGSLMERPEERGFAHFIEHLSFRGSREVPDGEAKRVWQRLGATFGSDSNAETTPTGTSYALDLPQADPAGLEESMKILAGMMAAPNIVPETVAAERAVILAEMRESFGPRVTVGDAARELYFAGQPLARGNPIGTAETLNGATAEALKAFHDRWYRPERTVIAISGDADPAMMEALVRRHFGAWQVAGAAAPLPDFGQPDPRQPETRVIVEPGSPLSLGLAWLRGWHPKADTIVYNRGKLTDTLALQLINRRLEEAARGGASFVQATVVQQDVSRSVDATFVSITPTGSDWKKALTDVRAIIADATSKLPSRADIEREYAAIDTSFAIGAQNADTEASATQAETMTGAVDIRETTVSPQAALDIFRSARPGMTPQAILASTRRMFTGEAKRALLTLRAAEPGADTALAAAFTAPVAPAKDVRLAAGTVTMAKLPKLGVPGKVVSRTGLGLLKVEQVTFSNGVKLLLFANAAEQEKVRIQIRFGNGEQSFAPGTDAALWAAPYVFASNGVANLTQREVDQLTNGRRIEFQFQVADDAFKFTAVSRGADYRDQLRLLAHKIATPRWDAGPVQRIKAVLAAGDSAATASPDAVLGRELSWLLRDKDMRFAPATAARAEALTPEGFRALWAPRFAEGPIEVNIFGDVNAEEAIAAVAATFGALPARPDIQAPAANRALAFPAHNTAPLVLRHDGRADQAAAVIAWPTGGGYADARDGRQLETVAQIINDRLFERLRSVDGAAYSPNVGSSWPFTYQSGGYLAVMSQVKPEQISLFGTMVRDIVQNLATTPVAEDELNRVVAPMRQLLGRASTGNAFWMAQTEGATRDSGVLPALRTFSDDLLGVTPADVQRLAAKYLVADRSWSLIVLPRDMPVPASVAQAWPGAPAVPRSATGAVAR